MASASTQVNLNDDLRSSVKSAAISSMILCMIFYILRIVSRYISKSPILSSDYLLFGGVTACYVISCVDLYVIRLGLGRHVELVAATDPDLGDVKTMLKFLMLNNCVYAFGQVTVKISLLQLYRYIFTSKRLYLVITITTWFMIAWGIAFVGVAIFSCNPIYAFWEFELKATAYCINDQAWYIAMAVPTILTDLLILAMPIRQVWKLQLDQKSKIALTFIFLLGSFVCIISVVRVTALFDIDNDDPTYTLVGIANWSSVEFAMAVICASLPTMRPLVLHFRPQSWSNNTKDKTGSRGYSHKLLTPQHPAGKFELLQGTGTESFAMHSTSGMKAMNDPEAFRNEHIVVSSTFSTDRAS